MQLSIETDENNMALANLILYSAGIKLVSLEMLIYVALRSSGNFRLIIVSVIRKERSL